MPPPRHRAVAGLLLTAGLLLGTGCGDDDGTDTDGAVSEEPLTTTTADPPRPTEPASPPDSSAPESSGAGDPDPTEPPTTPPPAPPTTAPPRQGDVRLEEVASVGSLSALAPHPTTGDLFLAQRDGLVVVAPAGGGGAETVLDLTGETEASGEQGLLGLDVAPDGGHLFLYYTDNGGDSRLVEYPLDGRTVDEDGRRELLTVPQPFANHNGGELSFGPDGYLYLGLGDGGGAGDPDEAGQDTDDLLGKILRIDPAGGGGAPYAIPADNPFVDGGGAPEVWLFGVRNPWRFSWDQATGDLWIGDVGQNEIEEIDLLPSDGGSAGRGANLGWNEMEGTQPFEGGTAPSGHVPPVYEYTHAEGCSVTGGYVYRGDDLPFLDGVYVFGDYCTGRLWGLTVADGVASSRLDLSLDVGDNELVSFGQDDEGEIYVLTNSGTLYRLAPG